MPPRKPEINLWALVTGRDGNKIYKIWCPFDVTGPDKLEILKAAYCFEIGDDLYSTPLQEALKHADIVPEQPEDERIRVDFRKPNVFVGEDTPIWMVV